MNVPGLLDAVRGWAAQTDDVVAIAVVGSYARGTARADSDVDLVLLVRDPIAWRSDTAWVQRIGRPLRIAVEDWGALQSVRVHLDDGFEVEFGIAAISWAAVPVDGGTARVVRDGMVVLYDPEGLLATLQRSVGRG